MIAFWWIVLDLPEISKSSNKIWNGKSVEIALRNDSEFLRCGPLCAQYLWAAFDISSALPGQYLSFCRNEFTVLMEYATSEIGQRWSPSWLQKVWDLKKRLFKDIQSKIGLKTVGLVFNPLEVRDLLEVCPILSHIDWLLKKTIFCCCLASCRFTKIWNCYDLMKGAAWDEFPPLIQMIGDWSKTTVDFTDPRLVSLS